MYIQISIRVIIAEELPNISRSVIHGMSRIVLTDWLNERLTSRYIYIGVDCLEHSRNYLNEIIIAYSRTWDFLLSTENIVNNLDDLQCIVYVTTTLFRFLFYYILTLIYVKMYTVLVKIKINMREKLYIFVIPVPP
jgi:hypothetical protein